MDRKTIITTFNNIKTPLMVLFLCALLSYLAFSTQETNELKRKYAALEQQINLLQQQVISVHEKTADIDKNLNTLSAEIKPKIDAISAETAMLKNNAERQFVSQKESELYISGMRTRIDELQFKFRYLRDFVISKYDEETLKENATPLPFSFFTGEAWHKKTQHAKNELRNARSITMDGGGGQDTLKEEYDADIAIDGMYLASIEIYDIANSTANTIKIMAPGLINLENDTLIINGDKDLDQVQLDGCLQWKQKATDKKHKTWTAIDSAQEKRTVKISNGIQTKISDSCNSDYLSSYYLKATAQATAEPQPKEQPQKFGGIGIMMRMNKNSGYIEITGIIPEKPAAKAGIEKGDKIIKINDIPVSQMTLPDVLNTMRGTEGTSVKITYIPRGMPDTSFKEVSLLREQIETHSNK